MRTIIFALLAITLCAPARAQDKVSDENLAEAKAAFAAGKAAYERGDYPTAIQQFQRANLLAPAPSLSYNIGHAYEKMGHYHDAVMAYERYLQLVGEPQNDQDKKFQADLRQKIASLKGKPDAAAPPPVETTPQPAYPPTYSPGYYYPYGGTYSPYVYNPAAAQPSRDLQLKRLHGQRRRAIALIVVGSVLTVAGLAIAADGFINPHEDDGSGVLTFGAANWTEDFFGISGLIVGLTLWPVGAASYVKSNRQIRTLEAQEAAEKRPREPEPQTFLFHSPVFHF